MPASGSEEPLNIAIERLPNGPLKNELQSWAKTGNYNTRLDFTYVNDIDSVKNLPDEIVNLLKDKVSRLSLPRFMSQQKIPAWLSELTELKTLEIPSYSGSRLDLKQVRPTNAYDLIISGQNIKEVHASEQADVHHQADYLKNQAVRVHLYDEGAVEFYTENALGYARLTGVGPDKKIDHRDLNSAASFPNADGQEDEEEEEIVCRHITVTAIAIHQKNASEADGNTQKPHSSALLDAEIGTIALLRENVSRHTENIYGDLVNQAPNNFLVGHSQWGDFFEHVFESIDSDVTSAIKDQKQMLLVLPHHAESIYFRKKPGPRGRWRYVLATHDANDITMRRRFATNSLAGVRKLAIDKFMEEFAINHNYGQGAAQIRTSLFVDAPADLYKRLAAEQSLFDTEQSRTVENFLSREEKKLSSGWLFYLLQSGLPIPVAEVVAEIANCRTSEERMLLLAAKNTKGKSGRMLALQEGHENAIEEHNEILITAMQNRWLTKPHFFDLLISSNLNTTGRSLAFDWSNGKVLRTENKIFATAMENDWLTKEQLKTLLSAAASDGTPGRYMAFQNDQWEAIEADNEILILAMKKGWVTKTDFMELLSPKFEGTSGRSVAIEDGCSNTIKADNNILLLARKNNWLTNDELLGFLIPKNKDGVSVFASAEQAGHMEACKECGRAILKAYENEWLERGQTPEADAILDWMQNNCAEEYLNAERQRSINQLTNRFDDLYLKYVKRDTLNDFLQTKSDLDIQAGHAMSPADFIHHIGAEVDAYLASAGPDSFTDNLESDLATKVATQPEENGDRDLLQSYVSSLNSPVEKLRFLRATSQMDNFHLLEHVTQAHPNPPSDEKIRERRARQVSMLLNITRDEIKPQRPQYTNEQLNLLLDNFVMETNSDMLKQLGSITDPNQFLLTVRPQLRAHINKRHEEHVKQALFQKWKWPTELEVKPTDVKKFTTAISTIVVYRDPLPNGKTTFVKTGTEQKAGEHTSQAIPKLITIENKSISIDVTEKDAKFWITPPKGSHTLKIQQHIRHRSETTASRGGYSGGGSSIRGTRGRKSGGNQ